MSGAAAGTARRVLAAMSGGVDSAVAAALVAEIDQARDGRNLSSAVRVWLLKEAAGR